MRQRQTVGYVRTYDSNVASVRVQSDFISRYATHKNLTCNTIYTDNGFFYDNNGSSKYREEAENLGIHTYRGNAVFKGWQSLLTDVLEGRIGCILVDTKFRLYNVSRRRDAVIDLLNKHQVEIIEVGNSLDVSEPNIKDKATVCYLSSIGKKGFRTRITLCGVDELYEYTNISLGKEVACLLLSNTELDIKDNIHTNTIVVRAFYHLNRHTAMVVDTIRRLNNLGTRVMSMTEGQMLVGDEVDDMLIKGNQRVVIYDRSLSTSDNELMDIRMDRLKAFVDYVAAGWKLVGCYNDKSADNQDRLEIYNLEQNVDSYDVILVESIARLFKDTSRFAEFMSKVRKPVYSLTEGGVIISGGKSGG